MARPDDKRRTGKGRNDARAARAVSAPEAGGFQTLFAQHQATAVDSLLRLVLDPVASLLTWAVIGIALALPLCLLLLLQNLQQVGTSLEQSGGLSLFMEQDVPAEQLADVQATLTAHPRIASVDLLTADEALAEFQAASGFGDLLEGLDENPLPSVFLVMPAEAADASDLQRELAALPGVELAQVDLEWVQRLRALVALAARFALLLASMLCVGVVLVIGNTVRLAIENRRAEIVVVKLVGGTDAYVSRPFLYTGLWYGVGGGLLAVLLIALALFALQGPVSALMQTWNGEFRLRGLGLSNSFLVLAGAGLLGWLGAWVSVMRHLRAIEPR
ncbi:MAG TPA: permease-like cell division protein FtsX [Pseudomonadales bacterium]